MKIPKKYVDIEMEHTKSRKRARKIAEQHMAEYEGYYPALIAMERKLKKRQKK
jgi:hypothetical protein